MAKQKGRCVRHRCLLRPYGALFISILSSIQDGDAAKTEELLNGADGAKHMANLDKADFLGFRPIEHAIAAGSLEVVEALLSANASTETEAKFDSVLHIACDHNEKQAADMVAALIAGGADVEHPGTGGVTPLYRALSKGNQAAVEVLLEAGADVDKENDHGVNAVDWAFALSQRFNNTRLHEVVLQAREKKWAADPALALRQEQLDAAAAKVGYVEMDARDKKPMG